MLSYTATGWEPVFITIWIIIALVIMWDLSKD